MIPALRITALLEGISFLVLLFIAMPLKYAFDQPDMVRITGMAHGVLFIAYVMLVLVVAVRRSWTVKVSFLALLASVLPFGTFVADRKIFRD
ncbi:DUF3817 domain-containing protein [Roseivirga sp. BDSF3-8]|uniref:DUF3817 domain-containing protein n=1 Tax=Roseivirga sp. BDSF3-8 TaxID=3241598 RepID=UPI0035323AED